MPQLVQKSGYIKQGRAGGYVKYIATREGVEKLHGRGPVTAKQEQLIANILRDFPDAKELFEYEDYVAAPNFGTASEFIAMALDSNAHTMAEGDIYMKYIATRPRVERRGDHGLFSAAPSVDLNAARTEVDAHGGNVWTIIYSLRREDAARLGYDSADAWRVLLLKHQADLAEAMKIPPVDLCWYAAFHDESHHPHIHMVVWSDDPKRGFLTKAGIKAMHSKLTNTIFTDEMTNLYQRKDLAYKDLVSTARSEMEELVGRMESSAYHSDTVGNLMLWLARELESVSGKKQYGYLPKPVKELVDSIVDELARQPDVADCYEVWNSLRDELQGYYKSRPRDRNSLSQQKEFRAIKNVVIQEAVQLLLELHQADSVSATEHCTGDAEQTAQRSSDEAPLSKRQNTVYSAPRSKYPCSDPAVLASVSRLLHHMGRIFRDNAMPPANPMGIRIDSKRRRKLLEKRLAMGHKIDDHENEEIRLR